MIQLEMEKLSVARSAEVDRHSRERLAALEAQLGALKAEQAVRLPAPGQSAPRLY